MATKEDMRIEAIRRLQSFGVMPEVVENFRNNKLMVSERQDAMFDGILYDIDTYKDLQAEIAAFEARTGYLVYHVQRTHFEFGELYACLIVTNFEEEWEYELDEEYCLAYVWNKTSPWCSEMGTVGIVGKNGGVSRTF